MSQSSGKPAPEDHRADDDALVFPAEAEPSDDTPTIISKTHPIVEPQATKDHVTDLGPRGAISESVMASLRGRKLAHFELIEPIGVGGMAAVLRAHDTQLDRQVALKILPPDMAVDPENIQRFHQEAKAAARLDHENIARVFYCGEDQGLHFIAFEYVDGENVRTLLERRGRLRVSEAVRYILQVALGLEHAAARGVVHRDVKPSNIIVSANGRAKLVDMGLARHMEPRNSRDLTHSGVTLGTFDYISPEQAMEPRDADTRSDIYSLGCTFYHMLTGQPPVPEGTAAKKLHHHQHIKPVDPRQLNSDIPDEVAMILGKMMEKDPKYRYQTPLQLVQHLGSVARKVGAADDLPEGMLLVDLPMPTGPRHRPLVVASIVMGALAAMFGLLWLLQYDQTGVAPKPVKDGGGPVMVERDKKSGSDTNPGVGGPITPATFDVVQNSAGFLRAVTEGDLKKRTSIKLRGTIPLADIVNQLDIEAGNSLVIESKVASAPATLQWSCDDPNRAEAIRLKAGNITFRNIRFEIKTSSYPEGSAIAGVVVRGADSVTFERCVFEQVGVPQFDPAKLPIIGVYIDSDGHGTPRVRFQECSFNAHEANSNVTSAGQFAVAVNGPADIQAENCTFRPHSALIQFQSSCSKDTGVKLINCSGYVSGPVFRFDPGASASLVAKKSVFARHKDAFAHKHEPNLIRQVVDDTPIAYQGDDNRYYDLNALWASGGSIKNTMETFREALEKAPANSRDDGSRFLTQGEEPWAAPDLPAPGTPNTPDLAFQLRPQYAALGAQRGPWGVLPAAPPEEIRLADKTKLFDPDYAGKPIPGVFTAFDTAWASMQPGETLLIKARKDGGEIKIPPTEINKLVDVAIKAFDANGPPPLLVLAKIPEKKDIAFFKLLVDGKLRFEGLHFLLESRQEGLLSQSLLLLGDSAQCAFERCLITLKPAKSVPLQVVSFVPPGLLMKMEDQPRSGNLEVQFNNCFVRGDGDLVNMHWYRALKLPLKNSLFVLSGSLVDFQAVGDEVSSEASPLVIDMNRVSAFTRDAVFSLHSAKNDKGLCKSRMEAHQCLFVPLDRPLTRPLISLKAPGISMENQVKDFVQWKGDQNCFAGFTLFLESQPPNPPGPMIEIDPKRWMNVAEETKMKSEDVQFPPLGNTPLLWDLLPDKFRSTDPDFADFGATAKEMDALVKSMK
jgi:predicted Ser/Thr protein kinase